jgi:hypothetical protein
VTGVGVDQTTLRSRAAHAAWEVPRADPAFNLALLESDAHGGAVIGVDVPEVARPYLGARKAVVHASRAASRDMGASACLAPPRLNDDVLIRPRNVRGRRWPRSRPEDDHNHDDDEREREYACDPEQPRIPARSGALNDQDCGPSSRCRSSGARLARDGAASAHLRECSDVLGAIRRQWGEREFASLRRRPPFERRPDPARTSDFAGRADCRAVASAASPPARALSSMPPEGLVQSSRLAESSGNPHCCSRRRPGSRSRRAMNLRSSHRSQVRSSPRSAHALDPR